MDKQIVQADKQISQADKQKGRHTNKRQPDKQTDRHKNKQTDRQVNTRTNKQANKRANTSTNKQTDKQIDRRRTDGQIYNQIDRKTNSMASKPWIEQGLLRLNNVQGSIL